MDGVLRALGDLAGFEVVAADGPVGLVEWHPAHATPEPRTLLVRVGDFEARTFEIPVEAVARVDHARRRVILRGRAAEHAAGAGAGLG
jgi:hypothetical protein